MNPNARTKPTELACSQEEASHSHGTRLIKYKLEPRIASTGGRLKENNALNKDKEEERKRLIYNQRYFFEYSPALDIDFKRYNDVTDKHMRLLC